MKISGTEYLQLGRKMWIFPPIFVPYFHLTGVTTHMTEWTVQFSTLSSYSLPLKLFLLAMYNILPLYCISNLWPGCADCLREKPVYLSKWVLQCDQ